MLRSYLSAAAVLHRYDRGCQLQWYVLAGIGYIESDHARSGGSAARHWSGQARPAIFGPPVIVDKKLVRALGPMQFLLSTWQSWGADGNHDGRKDPQQIDDATLAAANYLCGVAQGLGDSANLINAVYAYNHSFDYVRAVLKVAAQYGGLTSTSLGYGLVPPDPRTSPAPHGKTHRPAPKSNSSPAAPTASPAISPEHSPTASPGSTPVMSPSSGPSPTAVPSPSVSPSPSTSASPVGSASPSATPSATGSATP